MASLFMNAMLAYLLTVSIVSSQSIYVDRDTGYSALPCCAQLPLSIAVRDMSNGCGDAGHLTSYDCFCTTSFSYFSSLISREVIAQCTSNSTVASQAISVFNSYCAIGPNGTQATTAPTAGTTISCASSTLASPASGPTNSGPISTSSPTTTGPPPANSSNKSSAAGMKKEHKVVLGIVCMILVIIVCA